MQERTQKTEVHAQGVPADVLADIEELERLGLVRVIDGRVWPTPASYLLPPDADS